MEWELVRQTKILYELLTNTGKGSTILLKVLNKIFNKKQEERSGRSMDVDQMEAVARRAIEIILENIEKGIYTSYYVSQNSTASVMSINNLISGKAKIDKLGFTNAFSLVRFYQETHGTLPVVRDETEKITINE